jgi:hypothetical protein
MKTIKKHASFLLLLIFLASTFSSCMMTKTSVGEFQEQQGKEYTYSKGKQMWLFWGLVPLGRTSVNTPGDGNCEVITKFKFSDVLISGLTVGILTSYSIKVKAKEKEATTE